MKNKQKNTNKTIKTKEQEQKIKNRTYVVLTLLIIAAIAYFILPELLGVLNPKEIEYRGLIFDKQNYESLTFYHYAYPIESNGKNFRNNIYLREDPRKNNVSVEGNIIFTDKNVYITIDSSGFVGCMDFTRDVSALPIFLVNNLLNITAGTVNASEAFITKMPLVTCDKFPDNPVIYVYAGNETKITADGNCMKVEVSNCDLLRASEKFEVQSILDAYFRGENQLVAFS
jgi:hypothetical protein